MTIRFRQQVAAWLLVLKAATRTHAPGEPTRGLHERYLFILYTPYIPGEITAPGMGLSVGAPRGTGDRLELSALTGRGRAP